MANDIEPASDNATLAALLTRQCGFSIECARLKPCPGARMDVSTARSLIENALLPAQDEVVIAKLAEVASITGRRRDSDEGATLTLTAMAVRIRNYPGDIVVAALEAWPDSSEFFPTWKELREVLEPKTRLRRAWLDDLALIERAISTPAIAPNLDADAARAEREAAATAAERAEVSAGLRALVINLADARKAETKPGSATRKRFRGTA